MPIFSQKSLFKDKAPNLLVRPLLFANRSDIQKSSHFWMLPNYPDKSNSYIQYSRNRIRNQLLPTLRFFFNPQIEQALFQFGEIASLEHSFLEELADCFYFQHAKNNRTKRVRGEVLRVFNLQFGALSNQNNLTKAPNKVYKVVDQLQQLVNLEPRMFFNGQNLLQTRTSHKKLTRQELLVKQRFEVQDHKVEPKLLHVLPLALKRLVLKRLIDALVLFSWSSHS